MCVIYSPLQPRCDIRYIKLLPSDTPSISLSIIDEEKIAALDVCEFTNLWYEEWCTDWSGYVGNIIFKYNFNDKLYNICKHNIYVAFPLIRG